MRENLSLLESDLPIRGTKSYLVLEHLTSAELMDRGEVSTQGVIRLSLCDTQKGENPVPVYELLLDDDEMHNPVEAHAQIRTWATGFMLGAQYAGETIGMTVKPAQAV